VKTSPSTQHRVRATERDETADSPSTPTPTPAAPELDGPPASGSQPRVQLVPIEAPQPVAVVTVTRNPFSWLMPQPEMGVRIFAAGLVALIISLAGLITVAVRRRRW
jgi:hypothetical protein